MDAFQSVIGGARRMSGKSLLDFSPLTQPQKKHVARVYAALLVNVLMTGVGVYTQLYLVHLPSFLALLLSMSCVVGLSASSGPKTFTESRAAMFGAFGLLNGMLIADYLQYVHMYVGSQVVPTAFFASISIFACFSLSALMAKQRSYLYLGSFLGSALVYLSIASFLNMFLRTRLLFDLVLWGGLFMSLGFVVYDTQMAIAQFDMGDRDYLMQALQFYGNLLSIFTRLVAVLSERTENNRRKRDGSR